MLFSKVHPGVFITDVKGEFTLDNVTTASIIQISYIGYKTKEITVGHKKSCGDVIGRFGEFG